ncbi:hypothetical protein C9374_006002 [Naegleria lovaniensis]|uniref:Uncharacterized protein n=1 Tax=Naegleria lovaniensis TaxID=51637 RepID=A0AA88KJA5_NAELO|nr:uncharacterized protein C9374_006002 [Naegleria lovaniensis]KAG2381618.1 hypothetical protein C9374_006002 [Naegleria lovaniensis]
MLSSSVSGQERIEDQNKDIMYSTAFLKSGNPSTASSSAPPVNYYTTIQEEKAKSEQSVVDSSRTTSQEPLFASSMSSAHDAPITFSFNSPPSEEPMSTPSSSKRESRLFSASTTPQTPSKKRVFTEKEIEDLDMKYKQELAEMMQDEDPSQHFKSPSTLSKQESHTNGQLSESDEPILSVTQESPEVFMKSLSGMARIFYAQILRHEEKIESLTKANRKYQDVIKKKSEKISLLQHQLSTMVKQMEKYEQSLRQRVTSSPPSHSIVSPPPPSSKSSTVASSPAASSSTDATASLSEPLPPILAPKPKKRKTESDSSAEGKSSSSEGKIVKSRSNVVFKVKPSDCVNYNGATYILARAFEDKYKLKKMLNSYQTQTGENPQLFLRDEEFKKLKSENPDNLSVFAYRTSLYTMDFVNFYISNQ